MVSQLNGALNYYKMFKSPVQSSQSSPISNLIYGNASATLFDKTVAKRLSSNVSSYMKSIKSSSVDLKEKATPLGTATKASTFDKKTVIADSSSGISGTATNNANIREYTLNVSKLAVKQVNKSSVLNSSGSSFSEGNHTFSITSGEKTTSLSLNINQNESNKSVLGRIARSINNSNSGISASVVSDSTKGTSYVKMTSNNTGKSNAFSLDDISGNAMSTINANNLETNAENSEYELNGKKFTSENNTINIDSNMATVTFTKAENKDVTFSVESDIEGITQDISSFVGSYNTLVSTANNFSESFTGASKLTNKLDLIVPKTALERFGINENSDGTLSVDKSTLSSSLKKNTSQLKSLFSDNGIADKIIKVATEVIRSPQRYVEPNNPSYTKSANKNEDFVRGTLMDMFL